MELHNSKVCDLRVREGSIEPSVMMVLGVLANGSILTAIEDWRDNLMLGEDSAEASLGLLAGLRERDLCDDDDAALSSCRFPLGAACVCGMSVLVWKKAT
jgi:hypothetical protein